MGTKNPSLAAEVCITPLTSSPDAPRMTSASFIDLQGICRRKEASSEQAFADFVGPCLTNETEIQVHFKIQFPEKLGFLAVKQVEMILLLGPTCVHFDGEKTSVGQPRRRRTASHAHNNSNAAAAPALS